MALALVVGGAAASPALAENPTDELAAYVRARAAEADGAAQAAAAGYATALQGDPANPLIAVRAFRAALAAGDYPLATQSRLVLEKADTAPPDAALLALAEAIVAKDARGQAAAIDRIGGGALDFVAPALRAWCDFAANPDGALATFAKSATSPLSRRYAAENRALLTIASGHEDDGASLIQVLVSADQADPVLRIAAARLLAGQGKTDQARALLGGNDPVIAAARERIDPIAVADARFGVGFVLTRLASDIADGKAAKLSITLTRAALRIDPGNDRARLLLATALGASGSVDYGLAALDAIGPGSPWHRAAQIERINLLDAADRAGEAIALAATLAEAPGASIDDVRRHADLLMAAGSFALAARAYQRTIALDRAGADWVLYMLLGTTLEQSGDWGKAKGALERAVALAPEQPLALNALGYGMLVHGGDIAAAQRLLEKATRLKPGDLAIVDSLAWSYFVGGDVTRALPLLERAAAGRPGDSEISEHLGDAYWRLGRRYEARYAWQAARVSATPAAASRLAAKIANGPTGQ